MMELPQAFKEKMERLLGAEYTEFLESYEKERKQGLRLNLLKTSREKFEQEAPFSLSPIPWTEEGYYYGKEDRPGLHPYHEAGVYYIQEPSAMAVVSLLDPKPGERILDLCAAPGGKTSHIAYRLQGRGFLAANEIHPARAKILSQNVERMGIGNCAVFNETPDRLLGHFPEYFDRIVTDAPCSGEGMFRKDEAARGEWSPDNVKLCAERQAYILDCAAGMLKPGGTIAYSTCTFSPEEDEQAVEAFLDRHPEFHIKEVKKPEGLSCGVPQWGAKERPELARAVRIWPHKTGGEGHFIAILEKEKAEGWEDGRKRTYPAYWKDRKALRDYESFLKETIADLGEDSALSRLLDGRELTLNGEQLYLLPPELLSFDGLKVLRPGLHLGTMKKNRFEPSHALALWLGEQDALRFCRMNPDSPRLAAYLKGEAVSLSQLAEEESVQGAGPADKGWTFVTVAGNGSGYPIGWAKLAGQTLKNHYPKGLRR